MRADIGEPGCNTRPARSTTAPGGFRSMLVRIAPASEWQVVPAIAWNAGACAM